MHPYLGCAWQSSLRKPKVTAPLTPRLRSVQYDASGTVDYKQKLVTNQIHGPSEPAGSGCSELSGSTAYEQETD